MKKVCIRVKKKPTGLKVARISIEKREKQSQLPVKYIVLRLVKVPQLKLSWVKIGLKLTQDLQRFVKLENIPEYKEDSYHYLYSLEKCSEELWQEVVSHNGNKSN